MARARDGLTFCYGLFGIAGAVLLFRATFAACHGHDMCTGLFFAGWFLWAAVGALLFRRSGRLGYVFETTPELLLIACIPAFGLSYGLVVLLGDWAGFATALPLLVAVPAALLLGFGLEIMAGRNGERAVAAYGLEAAGGCAGGLGTTLLLYRGLAEPTIFLILAALVCSQAVWSAFAPSKGRARWISRAISIAASIAVLAALTMRVDARWTGALRQETFRLATGGGQFQGRFRTAKAQYLYGSHGDRWTVVRGTSVHETPSQTTEAGRIAAMALSQNFSAERILVFGDGLALCRSFLQSPAVTAVDWATPDAGYASSVIEHMPESLRISDPRFRCLTDAIPTILAGQPQGYDIVVVNLPGSINASLARFTCAEFFEQVRSCLRGLGLFVLGVTTDEAVTGQDPAYQGAWIKTTLNTIFTQSLAVPLENRTFFLCADTSYLQISPVTLEVRLGLLDNARAIFPPESLSQVYRPDAMLAASESYDKVELPEQRLVSSRIWPSTYLCRLQQQLQPWGVSLATPAELYRRGGLPIVVVPLVAFIAMSLAYVVQTAPRTRRSVDGRHRSVERHVRTMVGLSGLVGMGSFLTVTDACQVRYGSLDMDAGLLLSLFLLGLGLGAFGVRWLDSLRRHHNRPQLFSVLCVLVVLFSIHAGCLIGAGFWMARPLAPSSLALLLGAAGMFSGVALTLGALAMQACPRDGESMCRTVACAHRLGAAIGIGLVTVLGIPMLGFGATLQVLAVMTLACAVCGIATHYRTMRPGRSLVPHRILTPIGYALFGLALSVVAGAHIVAQKEQSQAHTLDAVAIENWSQGRRVSARNIAIGTPAREVTYHEVRQDATLGGYIFRSEDFAGTAYGYGGPMSVIVLADPNGRLIDFRITRSRETPRYIRRIGSWMESLKGRSVFGPDPLGRVDAVSGATLSCDAIIQLLREAGPAFAGSVLARDLAAQRRQARWAGTIDWSLVGWLMTVPLAIGAIYHGRLWSRVVVLAYTAGVGGFWLNRQFSTDQVMRLLHGDDLLSGSVESLCLLLGVPLLIVLFGNLYCGYLCPFGAIQELIALVMPKRFKVRLSLGTISIGRFVKYTVLFILVVTFFVTGSKRFLEADPLTSVFNRSFWFEGLRANPALITAILVLAAGLFLTRLWCRYLCPAGAFLSLLNLAAWLRRLLPAKKFGRCEFGLLGRDHLDCLYCDRCRYDSVLVPARKEVVTQRSAAIVTWLFLIAIVCVAVFVLTPVFTEPPAAPAAETTTLEPARDIGGRGPVDRPENEPMQRRRRRGR